MGRMLPEEFLPHFPSVVLRTKYQLWGKKMSARASENSQDDIIPCSTLLCGCPHRETQPTWNPAADSCQLGCVFREAKDTGNFCLACLPLGTVTTDPF